MSGFSGLSTALSALYAQRKALDVTGQNIANANTEGYSRQRAQMEAVGGPTAPSIFSTTDGVGAGVTVSRVDRITDTFLEARGRAEHAQNSYLADKKQMLTRIEQGFGEPSDTGLQSQLSEFWSSWHDLANQPGDLAARTQLLERGKTVVGSLRSMHDTFSSLFTTTREQLDALVTDVNNTATQIAQLNKAVVRANIGGQPVNELADQRDVMIMHVAELTGAAAIVRSDGAIDLTIGGSSLVSGSLSRTLASFGAARLDDIGVDPVGIRWVDNSATASISSGQASSTLETLGATLASYSAQTDAVVANIASTVNTQHAAGFDLAGTAGGAFFSGTTAATFAMAITDPTKIAAAGTGGTASLDGANADALAGISTSTTGPDRTYRQLVVDLGVAAQTVNRRAGIQQTITTDVDSARTAQSGVNLDEEMTNMISYQRAYEAASKIISVVDGMLDTLINRTGFGR